MTTNPTHSQTKTRDHSPAASSRRGERPSPGRDASASRSADEIREGVKEAVGKGVAAVAGVVEGLDETLQDTQLADTAESAIRQVGDMGTRVVKAAKEETSNLKDAFAGGASDANPSGLGPGFTEASSSGSQLSSETEGATFGSGDLDSGLGSGAAERRARDLDDEDPSPGL